MNFGKLVLSIFFLLLLLTPSAYAKTFNSEVATTIDRVELLTPVKDTLNIVEGKSLLGGPCTIRFEVTQEDGTVVSGTITFSDVNWFRCATLRVGAFFSRIF